MSLPATLHVAADYAGATGTSVLVAPSLPFLDAQLHSLGPTATLAWIALAWRALNGEDIDTEALARWLGIHRDREGNRSRTSRSLEQAIDRLARRHKVAWASADTLVVKVHAYTTAPVEVTA